MTFAERLNQAARKVYIFFWKPETIREQTQTKTTSASTKPPKPDGSTGSGVTKANRPMQTNTQFGSSASSRGYSPQMDRRTRDLRRRPAQEEQREGRRRDRAPAARPRAVLALRRQELKRAVDVPVVGADPAPHPQTSAPLRWAMPVFLIGAIAIQAESNS